LYLLCCERKGWNPKRSVSVFETEAMVSEGSVSKVLRGERTTLELTSIDTLLDGLYSIRSGAPNELFP
ncbi:MAG: hypothetical protein M3380_05180, partial [Chloroflexota bacterium]|nr:hypothetical protein [Chloroflexota bacterium]